MANYTAADVKRLRELTGAGMLDCKNALTETDGDFDKAVEVLRIKGAKDVGKRAERATAEGLVAAKDGALIELFARPRGLLGASLEDPPIQGVYERSLDAFAKLVVAQSAAPYR